MSDAEDVSLGATPSDDASSLDDDAKQLKALDSYLKALPYKAETTEEMMEKIYLIVGRIHVCIETNSISALQGWEHILQYWFIMRYPVPRAIRASLVKLYFEVICTPGTESRVVRGSADMLNRLIPYKNGSRPKLLPNELQLPWRSLWQIMKKQLWASASDADDSLRSDAATFLTVATVTSRYFPPSEIPDILDAILPLYNYQSASTVITLVTAFLPPSHSEQYLPIFFKLWESINSANIDERMLDTLAVLSRESISRSSGVEETEPNLWKDVGIFTDEQWSRISRNCLIYMNIPVGPRTTSSVTSTGSAADSYQNNRLLKKGPSVLNSLPAIFVYSMMVDGSIASSETDKDDSTYAAGSKALHSLKTIITSVSTYFHPSNLGSWSGNLATLIHRLAADFANRWHEERQPDCKTPVPQRLSKGIKREFVDLLKTPALLTMFSKDPISTAFAQATIKILATLEPGMIMPAVLERAYNGFESVNETHRVTAVLGTLAAVSPVLVSEKMWIGGQKHLVPLLELALPGIDINDPTKICALAFIASAVSGIKIGDLTQTVPLKLGSDAPGEDAAVADSDQFIDHLPDGLESVDPPLDREEERTLVRESSAAFPDWVVSFFRRIFAIFEALPEEGGKSNKTGGKLEESLLKTIRSAVDAVAHHLSDGMFDLVLKVTYDYATTTARANSVRAFGTLVSSLAKTHSKEAVARFLPYCAEQIHIELEHGASSTRTTSANLPVPSDTTLHWHLSILRGVLGNAGDHLLEHKALLINLLRALVKHTKNERGYGGTGRLIAKILSGLTGTYAKEQRFLNPGDWANTHHQRTHNQQWGKLYEVEDIQIDWHVPSDAEIAFAMEIMDEIIKPTLVSLEKSLDTPPKLRDSVWRNDFCRMTHYVRSAWSGLPTILLLPDIEPSDPYIDDAIEIAELSARSILMNAGFTVTSPEDPRYDILTRHRSEFGSFLHHAASSLVHLEGADDGDEHIDAISAVIKGIDTYLLDYAVTRTSYAAQKKSYDTSRDYAMTVSKQKLLPRSVWIKRAQVYHTSRIHTHSLYRRRTATDELLIRDLLHISLSGYTRARKNAQASLVEAVSYFVRSARVALDEILNALEAEIKLGKQADPDKQKGALHLLWNRSMAAYAMSTPRYIAPWYATLFSLRAQEKPSIQQLVSNTMDECIGHITAEAMDTSKAAVYPLKSVRMALEEIEELCGPFDSSLSERARFKASPRESSKTVAYNKLRIMAISLAQNQSLHWKYQHWALVLLVQLVRRDEPSSPDVARIFVNYVISDHPSMRHAAQRGLVKLLRGVKARTLSTSTHDLWMNVRKHPLRAEARFVSVADFVAKSQSPKAFDVLVDHIPEGPLIWKGVFSGYRQPAETLSTYEWESGSTETLSAVRDKIDHTWYSTIVELWSQEGDRSNASTDLRLDNVYLIKHLFKMFEGAHLAMVFPILEPILLDDDKFKQRAAAEFLTGLIRSSKHWPLSLSRRLWDWFTPQLPKIFASLTQDTLTIWESFINVTCADRDPRRVQPIVDFVFSLKIDFQSPSVFPLSKAMSWLLTLGECSGPRILPRAEAMMDLCFENFQTSYAEIRVLIITAMLGIMGEQWRPEYVDAKALLASCVSKIDPLLVRDDRHMHRIMQCVERLPQLRAERLPGASVSQSVYDKLGLTLLNWIWTMAYSPKAPSIFVYTKPLFPEILRMSELQDSSEVQQYSSGVLYILSAVIPPPEFIEPFTEGLIDAVKTSPSWRIRHKAIPVLSVWYFRNLPSLSPTAVTRVLEVLVECMSDENVEVRETAASTLSGVLRSRADKDSVIALKDGFARTAQRTRLPKRDDPKYADVLRKLHAAILGMIATMEAYPYVVESWMPPLVEKLARHASDPQPISTAIRKFAAEFKKTHQDTWHVDQYLFDEDQSQALQTIVSGTSYYA